MTVLNTGWVFPGTVSTPSGAGELLNPNNLKAEDAVYGTMAGIIADVTCTNFGFLIPARGTVVGVKLRIKWYGVAGEFDAYSIGSIKLYSGGVIGNLATAMGGSATNQWQERGGAADLWGATLSPAIINASNFGVFFQITASGGDVGAHGIDAVQLDIYYEPPPSGLFGMWP